MARPTSTPKNETSAALTRMREYLGLTQEQFAQRLRVATTTVARWESSHPPRGKTLERLYRFAQRNGPAVTADTFLRQITREKEHEYRRYRTAQIIDAGNVQDLRMVLLALWQLEDSHGRVDPFHDPERREYLLKMADYLCIGGRKEFLGEVK
jgi:transcriptional regulator with XRE-family HTH domain